MSTEWLSGSMRAMLYIDGRHRGWAGTGMGEKDWDRAKFTTMWVRRSLIPELKRISAELVLEGVEVRGYDTVLHALIESWKSVHKGVELKQKRRAVSRMERAAGGVAEGS